MAGKQQYDQMCPVATVLDIVGNRWALLVLRELLLGPRRFKDILDGLDGASTDMLTSRLRELEAAGLVVRQPDRRYARTDLAFMLAPVVRSMLVFSLSSGLFLDGPPAGGDRSIGPDPIRRMLGMVSVVVATASLRPKAGTYLLSVDDTHHVEISSSTGGYRFRMLEGAEEADVQGRISLKAESLFALLFEGVAADALESPIDASNQQAKTVSRHLADSMAELWSEVSPAQTGRAIPSITSNHE